MCTDTTPLAALLASHPEECAAVVAVLAISDPCDSLSFAGVMASVDHYAPGAMLEGGAILEIGATMGWIHVNPWREYGLQPETRYAIARMGAAAWLRARVGVSPREARYVNREAIAARVANVLGCRVGDVELDWRSSRLDSIYVRGEGIAGAEIAALIRDGFDPSPLGWDVPGDCGGEETGAQAPKGEQR